MEGKYSYLDLPAGVSAEWLELDGGEYSYLNLPAGVSAEWLELDGGEV